MKRRKFLGSLSTIGGLGLLDTKSVYAHISDQSTNEVNNTPVVLRKDTIIIGGGLGGVASSLALLKQGHSVLLTEETDWLGGQLTSQGVPPDEHEWIESHGAPESYLDFRKKVRSYYQNNYPIIDSLKENAALNPGNGAVSRLCHEPIVALRVIESLLAPYIANGQLTVMLKTTPISAEVDNNKVIAVLVKSNEITYKLYADYFVDATELGDLLPLTGTEYITGTESKSQTNELHAPDKADTTNNQAFTMCFAIDYVPNEDHTIEKPKDYDFWYNHVPPLSPPWSGKILGLHYSYPRTLKPKELGFHPEGEQTENKLNLWNYRRIIDKNNFTPSFFKGDITIVNWPQNDYMLGNLIDVFENEFNKHIDRAKQLSLSLLYWLQTEAPRPDGGKGWKGLRLRKDIMGTEDGLAKYPYVRESRRIKAEFTVLEEHVGRENRAIVAKPNEDKTKAKHFEDSVGIGYYHIDLHPTSNGVNYVDFSSLPFQIPLGSLLPIRMENIFPANKNIGTTHITNGCYRLHPVEWSIGEAVGHLISYAKHIGVAPRQIRKDNHILKEFQTYLHQQGVQTEWPI
ncbi:FAD-dependent oxidoreductase [Sphingobacterium sp. UT-1RO-CII-1]|uniref:FAD-dependent oxidoreductase n=1 Tax=Sphingobacterium sp. UT-1RO-CII-1 TaxID=2995225 RepID=UPI00227BF629|nr:FAD-dependent oxidoreductase [Sphingobacterium sp. UT-1RO-CII-1]MCY4780409.1 FAD-dependent oxidoreductase [Sphingobacterium sp. UT-1RO-CII-1]